MLNLIQDSLKSINMIKVYKFLPVNSLEAFFYILVIFSAFSKSFGCFIHISVI